MSAPKYERILAGDIRKGDNVARARTHTFKRVVEVRHGPIAATIVYRRYEDPYRPGRMAEHLDRPRKTAKWWREV